MKANPETYWGRGRKAPRILRCQKWVKKSGNCSGCFSSSEKPQIMGIVLDDSINQMQEICSKHFVTRGI